MLINVGFYERHKSNCFIIKFTNCENELEGGVANLRRKIHTVATDDQMSVTYGTRPSSVSSVSYTHLDVYKRQIPMI